MLEKIFSNNSDKITKNLWVYFSGIFCINLIFKITGLESSSFWYDEIISVQSASLDFGHIKHVSEWDNNPPFYFYCLSVWIKLFNDSEFTVRLLSVIFSSLSAGFLFIIANKFFNKISAINVSFLYLASNFLFFYSHEARAYSLVVLLVLLSTFLFLSFKYKNSWLFIFLLGLINFLIIYTHYIAGLVLLFQLILMLAFYDKPQKIKFSYSLLITLIFVLLRFTKKQFLLIFSFGKADAKFWLKKSDYSDLIDVFYEFLFSKELVIPFILIIIFGLIIYRKYKTTEINFSIIYSVLIGVGSILILYVLGKISPLFLDRYLIFSIPFILLLLSFSLSFFKHKLLGVLISGIIFLFFVFKIDFKTDKGMDYKNAMVFIKAIKKENDLIIVKTKDIQPLFSYYYDKDYFKLQIKELPPSENVIFCNSWSDVTVDLNKYNRVIVIDSFDDLNPNEMDFVSQLSLLRKKKASVNFYEDIKISFYN